MKTLARELKAIINDLEKEIIDEIAEQLNITDKREIECVYDYQDQVDESTAIKINKYNVLCTILAKMRKGEIKC